jgi:hypothetical protein
MRKIMAVAMSKESMKILCEVPFKNKTITELDISWKNLGVEGALVIAEYLDGNGALSSLNLANNELCGIDKRGMGTLDASGEHPLFSSDCCANRCTVGVVALVDAIRDSINEVLLKLDVSYSRIPSTEKAQLKSTCDAKGISLAL